MPTVHTSSPVWWAIAIAAILAGATTSTTASARDSVTVEQARDAFDQGTAAYRRGEYAQAADYFARADELIPSNEALEAALECARRADDAVLSMRLVDRAGRALTPSNGLVEAMRVARERFQTRTGRLVVRCTGECTATLDGRPVTQGVPTWTLAGPHAVVAAEHGAKTARSVTVVPDRLNEVVLTVPVEGRADAPGPASEPPGSKAALKSAGVSPTWVWIGAGATALLGGAAVVSGLDTLGRSDDFENAGCEARGSDACDRIAESGRSARLRTNVFAGGAALAGIASVVFAVSFVDWKGRSSRGSALRLEIGPGSVALSRTWP